MRKYLKRVAVIGALSVAATIGVSSPALAADYGSYQNRRQNACLDSDSAGAAYTLGCNTGSNQDWDLQFISGTSYYLKNRATGRCLDANSANSAYTLSCNGGTNQRWRRVYSGTATAYGQWINVATGKCLTSSVYADKRAVFTSVCVTNQQTQLWDRI